MKKYPHILNVLAVFIIMLNSAFTLNNGPNSKSSNSRLNDLKIDTILLKDICIDTNTAPKFIKVVVENSFNQDINNIFATVKWGNLNSEKALWAIPKINKNSSDTLVYFFPNNKNLYSNKFISIDLQFNDVDSTNNDFLINFMLSSKTMVNYISPVLKKICEGYTEVLNPNDRLKRTFHWYDAAVNGKLIHVGETMSVNASTSKTYYLDVPSEDRVDSVFVNSETTTTARGVYFYIVNNNSNPQRIHSFELSSKKGIYPLSYQVYCRKGSYSGYENNQIKWNFLNNGLSVVNDFGNALIKFDSIIYLLPNDTISFFVHSNGSDINSSYLHYKNVAELSSTLQSKNLKLTYGNIKTSSNPFTGTVLNSKSIRIILNFYDISNCLNATRIPFEIVVNPFLKSSISASSSNILQRAGTISNPDIICASVPNFYKINTPIGFSESDYNIKWRVEDKRVKDSIGFILHQSSDTSRTFGFTPVQFMENKVYLLSYSIHNMVTDCYTSFVRYIKIIPDNRDGINLHGTISKCEFDSIKISAVKIGLDYRYLWSTGDTSSSIKVKNPGKYKLSVYTGNCSFYSDSVNIVNSPNKDSLPILVNYLDSCYVELYTLLIPGSVVYWHMGDGTILKGYKVKYKYAQNGTYSVRTSFIAPSNYCIPDSISNAEISILCIPNGINESLKTQFRIFPNPTNSDFISIVGFDSNQSLNSEKVEVYDSISKLVSVQYIQDNKLNVSVLNSGMYIIKINESFMKFIKL